MELAITPATIASSAFFGIISAYFAHRQGRNPYRWFFIGLFFGMLGCFALLFVPKMKKTKRLRAFVSRKLKTASLDSRLRPYE